MDIQKADYLSRNKKREGPYLQIREKCDHRHDEGRSCQFSVCELTGLACGNVRCPRVKDEGEK